MLVLAYGNTVQRQIDQAPMLSSEIIFMVCTSRSCKVQIFVQPLDVFQ